MGSKRKGRAFGKINPIKNRDKFTMNTGRGCTVINYINANTIEVKFDDGLTKFLGYDTLRGGKFSHPLDRTIFNVGYIGIGQYTRINSQKVYEKWHNMLERVYSRAFHKTKKSSTYKGTMVCKQWHNFQNFAEWFYRQEYQEGWELDKDALSTNVSVYSAKTCVLVPRSINMALLSNTGVCLLNTVKHQRRKPYQSNISIKNVKKTIGYFYTENAAHLAYLAAKREYIDSLITEETMSVDLKNLLRYAINVKFSRENN